MQISSKKMKELFLSQNFIGNLNGILDTNDLFVLSKAFANIFLLPIYKMLNCNLYEN